MSTLKTTNLQAPSAASPAFVLAADGSATAQLSSLNGGALSGARNRIINGDMRIDQRNAGASVTPTSLAYTVDRWAAAEQTDGSITVQRSTTAPAGFANSLLVTVTSADASLGATQYAVIDQPIEGTNVDDLAWGTASAKTVTLSFWVRSSVTGTFGGSIQNSAQDRSYPFSYTISSANAWEQKSITIAGDTSGTWLTTTGTGLAVWFSLAAGSTYSGTSGAWGGALYFAPTSATNLLATNGATFYITGVQLEAGSVATPFERRSYGQELALCQRYYTTGRTQGWPRSTDNVSLASSFFKQTMRATPTVTQSDGLLQFTTADGFGSYKTGTSASTNWDFTWTAAIEL